jgi:ubiquinone/menaquinone biosynthesis C-methylase UbiE
MPPFSRLYSSIIDLFFKQLYHQFAWGYDWVAAAVSLGEWNSWTHAALPYLHGPRVLELGFGPGHLQVSLQKREIWTVGIDESWQMASQAICRLKQLNLNPRLINGYAQFLPFSSLSFEQVVATFPTRFIFNPITLTEIQRVLAPGGTLVTLPIAWITGRGFLHRMAAGLFHLTGQSPDLDDNLTLPFIQAGFLIRLEQIQLKSSKILFIIAQKPR